MAQGDVKISGNILYLNDVKIAIHLAHKVAITSMKHFFADLYKLEGETWKWTIDRLRKDRTSDSYFQIAVCRNPWRRTQSTYIEKMIERQRIKPRVSDCGFYLKMPFNEFVSVLSKTKEDSDKHFQSQYITLFCNGIPNFIVRLENFEDDWKKVQSIFRDRGRVIGESERMNVTATKKPALNQITFDAIRDRYIEDVHLLGYDGLTLKDMQNGR